MSNVPESSDSSFTFDLFSGVVNKDLNGVLGNFVSRVLKMTASKIGNTVPAAGAFETLEKEMIKNLQTHVDLYLKYMNELEFRKALAELRAVWVEGNNYITASEPWTVIKEDPKRAGAILNVCINLIRIFAILNFPVMPETAENMLARLNLKIDERSGLKDFNVSDEMVFFKGGESFEVGEALFERISPERVEELKAKYGSAK